MKISQPTPELPVPNVRQAQEHYRDQLGFEIAWYNDEGRIGAVPHGKCAIFFREFEKSHPATFWVFCKDIEDAYKNLAKRGANVLAPPENTPWGLRQFTFRDPYENQFHFFHDL